MNQGFAMYDQKMTNVRQLIIIETSPRWNRQDEFDMPAIGTIVEVVHDRINYPVSFIHNFNRCAIKNVSMLWAALTYDTPDVGKIVKIIPIRPEDE